MKRTSAAACAGAVLGLVGSGLLMPGVATAAVPGPVTIDFSAETTGAKGNGYVTAASPDVFFYDTSGADLSVFDYGIQSNGRGLGVQGDDASALEIRLGKPATAISLAFGNDDPGFTDTTDQAQLTLYRGAVKVGQVSVNVNSNDVMDQRVSHHGAVFNRATFQYVNAADVPKNLIEIVDDIVVGPLCTVVGNNSNNNLTGTPGSDVFCAEGGSDTIKGLGGDDLVYSGAGNDEVRAGAGADTVVGAAGRDRLSGGSGRDHLNGGVGRDYCNGGTGTDTATRCEVRRRIP